MTSHLFQHLFSDAPTAKFEDGGSTNDISARLRKQDAAMQRVTPRPADTTADLRFDEAGTTPVDAHNNPIPWTRRPSTREADGSTSWASPALPEIIGNMFPTSVPAGALASGPNIAKAARAALNTAENMSRNRGTALDFYNELKNTKGVKEAEPLPPLNTLTPRDDAERYADGGSVPYAGMSDEKVLASASPASANFAGPRGDKGARVQQLDNSTINWRSPLQIAKEEYEAAKHMPSFVKDVMDGNVDLRSPEGVDEAVGMAGKLAGYGLGASTVVPSDATVGMFIGRNAKKHWDDEAVNRFHGMKMHEDPAYPGSIDDEIWHTTGVKQFADGSLRQEISDAPMKLRPLPYGPKDTWQLPLERVIEHPELFEAYPHLKDLIVQSDPAVRTAHFNHFHPEGARIVLGGSRDEETILHEIQHAIDRYENHKGRGSSPLTAYRDMMNKLPQSKLDDLAASGVEPGHLAMEAYTDEVGEQIAELTAKRRHIPKDDYLEPLDVYENRIRARHEKEYAERGDKMATPQEWKMIQEDPLAYADLYGMEGRRIDQAGRRAYHNTPFIHDDPIVLGVPNEKAEDRLLQNLKFFKQFYAKAGKPFEVSPMVADYPEIPKKW